MTKNIDLLAFLNISSLEVDIVDGCCRLRQKRSSPDHLKSNKTDKAASG